jgi:hypothetical protein
LLSLAQGISYKTSATDKLTFPEETIFNGEGDCEDTAFLLAYLVKKLTSVKPYLTHYNKHMNVGFKCDVLNDFKPKATFMYNNECFFSAETTNIIPLGSFVEMNDKLIKVISIN